MGFCFKKQANMGKRIWIDSSPKEIYRWQMSTWRDAQYHLPLGKCKSNYISIPLTPTSRARIKTRQQQCWWGCGAKEILMHSWWDMKGTLQSSVPCDPAIPLWNLCPGELETTTHTKTCTWMFTTALLIMVKKWKRPICPWTADRINKMHHILQSYLIKE